MLTTPILATLVISAAASLQAPLEEIAAAFEDAHPDVTIAFNFGGSNALARQIENGAPSDLLLSAGPIPNLEAISITPFLTNSLVLIARREVTTLTSISELQSADVQTIAIANPSTAPAGAYAIATLDHLKLTATLEPKFIFAKDVRQALTYVATGNADAGFVYATDVTNEVRLVGAAPPDSHPPITYQAALIQDTPAARAFLESLSSEPTQTIFQTHGFTPSTSEN